MNTQINVAAFKDAVLQEGCVPPSRNLKWHSRRSWASYPPRRLGKEKSGSARFSTLPQAFHPRHVTKTRATFVTSPPPSQPPVRDKQEQLLNFLTRASASFPRPSHSPFSGPSLFFGMQGANWTVPTKRPLGEGGLNHNTFPPGCTAAQTVQP